MDKNNSYSSILVSIYRNIQHYKKIIVSSTNPYQKLFYENLLYHERLCFHYWKNYYSYQSQIKQNQLKQKTRPTQRIFTIEELAQYDGSNGKPAYAAVNGIVYDVSLEATWGGGTHFSLYAGKDLTAQFNGCHRDRPDILKNLPEVGMLQQE